MRRNLKIRTTYFSKDINKGAAHSKSMLKTLKLHQVCAARGQIILFTVKLESLHTGDSFFFLVLF